MIDKYRLEDLRRESGEKGELARWVIQLQKDLDDERRKAAVRPPDVDERLAAHEQEPVAYDQNQRDLMNSIVAKAMKNNLERGDKLVMADVFAATMALMKSGFRTHPAPSGTNQVDELVIWVKRLVKSLKKANPDSKLHLEAMDYLKRNALIGLTDVLRVAHPAPSIPTVSFYRDGIEAAAKWVDAQREAYDNEHGRTDPDTGSFEFGNDAQLENSATLAEIAEGIRALHPNAASAPSIPAAVPEEMTGGIAMIKHRIKGSNYKQWTLGWNACRAAMLQSEPNGWIPVSERYPDVGDIVLTAIDGCTNVGEMERSAANYRYFTSVVSGRELPATHWQPLPAAPKV